MTSSRPSGARARGPGESTLYRIRVATSARQLKALFFATLAGCFVFLSFPDYDVFPLQWISLVPLFYVMSDRRPGRAFGWGVWAGFVTNWGGFYWVTGMLMDFGHFSLAVAIPICSLMCLYQGLVFGLFAGLSRWIMLHTNLPLLWVAPTVFTFVEYALPLIFPWYMGNGQYRFAWVCQIVELTGVSGLTFLIVFVNAAIYTAIRAWRADPRGNVVRPLALAGGLLTITLVFGVVRIQQVDASEAAAAKLRIGLGEANVGIFEKEAKNLRSVSERVGMLRGNIMKHHLLGAELERSHDVDLIVLPESSFIPVFPPYAAVRYKRTDAFMYAVTLDGRILERTAEGWQPADSQRRDVPIHDVASAGEHQSIAVGARGLVLRHEEGGWAAESSGTDADLHGAWAGPAASSYGHYDGDPWIAAAAGDRGTFLVRHAGKWRAIPGGGAAGFEAIAGVDAMNLMAVGRKGAAFRYTGESLEREDTGVTVDLHDIWARADDEFWAVGDAGTVLTCRGGKWTQDSAGTTTLRAIAGGLHGVFVGGDEGVFFGELGSPAARTGGRAPGADATPAGAMTWQPLGASGAVLDLALDPRGDPVLARGSAVVTGTLRASSGTPGSSRTSGGAVEGTPLVTWSAPHTLADAVSVTALTGVPYTAAHAYARDARWVDRSATALPRLDGSPLDNVGEVQRRVLPEDGGTPESEWNVPIRGFSTAVLLGLITYDSAGPGISPVRDGRDARKTYNSAMLLDGDGRVLGRYDKNYLLIFGEYIPFGDRFPQFYEWLPEASHFYPGTTVETFPFKGHQLGVMICYEDIIPRFTRRLADKDPNVIINVTNDAWFGKTSEPAHHLALATFRAIENRLWLVRSTNTGISAFVDSAGRIVGATDLDNPEVLVRDVPMLQSNTIYRSLGDWFAWLLGLATMVAATNAALASRRSRVRGSTT